MKKALYLIFFLCFALNFNVVSVYAEIDEKYLNKIVSVILDNENPYAKFEVGFVNEDSIPDVLISTGDSHAAGVMIYLLKDNDIFKVTTSEGFDSFGDWGINLEYIPYGNTIKSYSMFRGNELTDFYSLEGSYANSICSLEYSNFRPEESVCYKDEIQVTIDEYQAAMDKYYNGGKDFVSISSYENLKILNKENIRNELKRYWPIVPENAGEVIKPIQKKPDVYEETENEDMILKWSMLGVPIIVAFVVIALAIVVMKKKSKNISSKKQN